MRTALKMKNLLLGTISRYHVILYMVTMATLIVLLPLYGICEFYDTESYVTAWDTVRSGGIDIYRTPVYPVIIGCMMAVFGDSMSWGVVGLQAVVYMLSVHMMCMMTERMLGSRRVALAIGWVYVFATVWWVQCILTESLAASLVVFLLYCTFSLFRKFSARAAVGFFIMLALIQFLRPAFIYLLPMLAVWWVLVAIVGKKYKSAIAGVAGTLAVSAMMLIYMVGFEKQHGTFSITNTGKINKIAAAVIYAKDYPHQIDDPILLAELETNDCEDIDALNDRLTEFYKRRPDVRVKNAVSRFVASTNELLFDNYISYRMQTIGVVLSFRLSSLYLFLLIYGIILIYVIIVGRKIPLFTVLIYVWILSHVFVMIVGAHAEYGRLVMPILSLILLLVGQVCSMFVPVMPLRKWHMECDE